MKNKDFCVFILSHGRPDNIRTLKTLKKSGFTGQWYIVIDDEDKRADEYFRRYGDRVIQFCKADTEKRVDTMDIGKDRRCILFARNECFDIAERLGFRYFLELDDDYTSFEFRYKEGVKLKVKKVENFDEVCDALLSFLKDTPTYTIAMSQGGDFIGGCQGSGKSITLKRKAMNSFFCDTQRPFKFIGRINEDVNTYVGEGSRGKLFFTTTQVALVQQQTQKSKGGMSDIYGAFGTYVKSFYSVIMSPSCVSVAMMGDNHYRLHHHIDWRRAVPLILRESVKR